MVTVLTGCDWTYTRIERSRPDPICPCVTEGPISMSARKTNLVPCTPVETCDQAEPREVPGRLLNYSKAPCQWLERTLECTTCQIIDRVGVWPAEVHGGNYTSPRTTI